MNFKKIASFFMHQAWDDEDARRREKKRYRSAAISMFTNLVSRGISLAVMVLTVTLTSPYLGQERFGLWMTIASFAGMLAFMDLGIGNALTNRVALSTVDEDSQNIKKVITGGIGFLCVIAILSILILLPLALYLPWDRIIKTQDPIIYSELNKSLISFVFIFALNLLSNGIQRIFYGLQRAYEANISTALGSLISLTAILIAYKYQAGIPYLLAATFGGVIIGNFLLLPLLIIRGQFDFKGIYLLTKKESKELMGNGLLFLVLQIGTMIGWGADALIISSTLGTVSVASFALVQKIYQIGTQPMAIFNAPLWAAYAEANGKGEKKFIRKTLGISLAITFIYTLLIYLVLLIFGVKIVNYWTSGTVQLSFWLIVIYGLWVVVEAMGNALAMFLNGCNIVKQQVRAVIALCLIALPVKIYLITHYGLIAMIAGFIGIYLTVFTIAYAYVYRESLKTYLI